MAKLDRTEEVLGFWLDEVGPTGWYEADPALDDEIAARFAGLWDAAREGQCDDWSITARGALALLIVLDQFPRNLHRGRREAFATDASALSAAKSAIGHSFDLEIEPPARQFFYLPLMHSEVLADQERCVRLVLMRLGTGDNFDHAVKHRDVIRRFGRFPSRNAALGRTDRPEERAYRESGGYMG